MAQNNLISTNLDLSSADESSADNATSQGASANESRSPSKMKTGQFPKRYQRTRSYDESYYMRANETGALKHDQASKATKPQQYATLHRNTEAYAPFEAYRRPFDTYYGSGYLYPYLFPPFEPPAYLGHYGDTAKSATLAMFADHRRRQLETIYRSTPMLNYGANSYFGWHQHAPPPPSQQAPPDLLAPGKLQAQTFDTCTPDMNTNTTGSILFDKETVSPFFSARKGTRGPGHRRKRCSPAASFCVSSTDDMTLRRNRIKLCIVVTILVIIVAVLTAMGIAVYSQLKTQNSVVKLVRQYRTSFIVTGGRQLDYDADLLTPQSQSFKTKAKEFEHKIDSIFRDSGLASIYEGVEVSSFRFVVEPPGMELTFNIKIKVNVQLQVQDILAVMDDAIRHNVGGVFQDSVIDPKSLSVENQRVPPSSSPPTSGRRVAP